MSKQRTIQWALIVALLLTSWGLRLMLIQEVPPGWRDDELINVHALSRQVLEGSVPLYYLGASGHEPLYHHLHAIVHAVLGFNVLSGHILSIFFGTLSVALTYVVARRLFRARHAVSIIASLAMTVSFWSLMYSRTAIRHISLPPFVLATVYLIWCQFDAEHPPRWRWGLVGLLLAGALHTYTASRLLPILVVGFSCYLALFHSGSFSQHWRGLALALVVMAALAAPLGVAIAQGRSARAIKGVGADARVTELAKPLRELSKGNPEPLLRNVWKTLGMFHATGDPEWLYNIPERPVFNLLGGTLFWVGVGLSLRHWRRPRYFFLILWLGLGLIPAFVSIPPASLSHTILAQPAAYILPALSIVWVHEQADKLFNRYAPKRGIYQVSSLMPVVGYLLATLFLTTNGLRDLRDYFVVWPQRGMVRLLYRSDYREAARYLNARPGPIDVALGSALMGPWDRLALDTDIRRSDVAIRLFNPERALVSTASMSPASIILTSWPDPAAPIRQILEAEGSPDVLSRHLAVYQSSTPDGWQLSVCDLGSAVDAAEFDNGLALTNACWLHAEDFDPGQEGVVATIWRVAAPLDLPPMPVIANPPPPKVYSGPRLTVFAHLLDEDGAPLTTDDGLWVDPLTLQTGDRFLQLHRLSLPTHAPEGPYTLELGLYDPKTGERRNIIDARNQPHKDRLLLPGPKNQARLFEVDRVARSLHPEEK